MAAETLRWKRAAEAAARPKAPAPTTYDATPAVAWNLYREKRMDLHKVAARLGISRSDVLALVAEYKPVADAQEFERMRRAGEPTYAIVDPRARETFVKMGALLGVRERDPATRTWADGSGQKIANRLGADHYVDGDDLWLWPAGATTEEEQRESAAGIRILPDGGGYDVLDGWQRKVGRLACLKSAVAMAGRMMRSAAHVDG
jgi:hypothetical protein